MSIVGEFAGELEGFLSTLLDDYIETQKARNFTPAEGRFLDQAERTPAYLSFLKSNGIDFQSVRKTGEINRLPVTNKANYIHQYPLAERCVDGRLDRADILAVSSGTSGVSVMWPRSLADEIHSAFTFETIFRTSFQAHHNRTLGLVCFPLGIWIGGMHTVSSLRLLALKGYGITCLTPGINLAEIRRCLTDIAPLFDQTVMIGYPPFLRDVLNEVVPSAVDPQQVRMKLLLAGESVSEAWRDTVGSQLSFDDVTSGCIGMYGTADAGVIAFESSFTIKVRRQFAAFPKLNDSFWGRPDTPALFQYYPGRIFIESDTDSIILWKEGTHPHIRYDIGDVGTAADYSTFTGRLGRQSRQMIGEADELPFVSLFGRRDEAVSFFGGNVFPEHIASLVDRAEYQTFLTGRFAVLVRHTASENKPLDIVVEAKKGVDVPPSYQDMLAEALEAHLVQVNSEYANYVPAKYRRPEVLVANHQDTKYFERGRKQRYIQTIR